MHDLSALEIQVTENGAIYRDLLKQHEILRAEIESLRNENSAIKERLEKITSSKKWQVVSKFANYRNIFTNLIK